MTLVPSEEIEAPMESSASAVRWGPIIAGALTAAAATLILVLLGSGLGLSVISPWSTGVSATTFAVSAAVWLIVVQWLSSALGGYLTGRLRTKWVGVHDDEVYFRDTAHGFLAWALATMLVHSRLGRVVGDWQQRPSGFHCRVRCSTRRDGRSQSRRWWRKQ